MLARRHDHARFADQLDLEAARNLLLVSFFMGGTPDPKVVATLRKRFPEVEIGYLAALNFPKREYAASRGAA